MCLDEFSSHVCYWTSVRSHSAQLAVGRYKPTTFKMSVRHASTLLRHFVFTDFSAQLHHLHLKRFINRSASSFGWNVPFGTEFWGLWLINKMLCKGYPKRRYWEKTRHLSNHKCSSEVQFDRSARLTNQKKVKKSRKNRMETKTLYFTRVAEAAWSTVIVLDTSEDQPDVINRAKFMSFDRGILDF